MSSSRLRIASLRFGLTAGIIILSYAPAAPAQILPSEASTASAASSSDHYAELSQQIEIMRLVLTRRINTALKDQKKTITDTYRKEGAQNPRGTDDSRSAGTAAAPRSAPADQHGEQAVTLEIAPSSGTGGSTADITAAGRLYRALASGESPGGGYLTFYADDAATTSNTRGFYAPDVGVLYSTEVGIPIRAVEPSVAGQNEQSGAAPQKKQDDLWAQTQEQVQQQQSGSALSDVIVRLGAQSASAPRYQFDERFVTAVEDSILGTIGEYGTRLTQMSNGDTFIIALRLTPAYNVESLKGARADAQTIIHSSAGDRAIGSTTIGGSGSAAATSGDTDADIAIAAEPPTEGSVASGAWSTGPSVRRLLTYTALGGLDVGSVREEQLVIAIPLSAVESLRKGEIDQAGFRKRATITRF